MVPPGGARGTLGGEAERAHLGNDNAPVAFALQRCNMLWSFLFFVTITTVVVQGAHDICYRVAQNYGDEAL